MSRMTGVPVSFRTPAAIDSLAAAARLRFAPDVPPDGKLDIMQVLENVDGTVMALPSGRRAKVKLDVQTLEKNVLAETRVVDDRIYLVMSETTYRILSADEGWARFTAAHEIGHVMMHLPELAVLERITHRQAVLALATADHKLVVDSEFQANTFAAAFLAPDEGLHVLERLDELTVEVVMKTFGMGRLSANYRIDNYRQRGTHHPGNRGPHIVKGGR